MTHLCGMFAFVARSLATFAVLVVFTAVASAYTLVLRDGRQLVIPDRFIVTKHTLTYEVADGIQLTRPLSTINIAATEKANNESPGSFVKRGFTVVSNAFPVGFGGVGPVGGAGFGGRFGGRGFGGGGRQGFGHSFRGARTYASPPGVAPLTFRVGFSGGPVRGRGAFGSIQSGGFRNRGFGVRGFGVQNVGVTGFGHGFGLNPFGVGVAPILPFGNLSSFSGSYYDYGYERSALVMRLDELRGRKAALRARWRDLEEEARRAGVDPGWLRP